MIFNKSVEIKIRKNKISTILTSTNVNLPISLDEQLNNVTQWAGSASKIVLFSDQKPIIHDGLRLNKTAATDMAIINVLRSYVVQIPGNEVFAIAAPNVLFSSKQEELFNYVEHNRMERTWAAVVTHGEEPIAFIMTAPMLPHILRDLPPTLTFGNNKWAIWIDAWMKKFMLRHRYFNANHFNIVTSAIKQTPPEEYKIEQTVLEPIPVPFQAELTPTPAATLAGEQKAPRKPGRPKKVQQPTNA